MPTVRKQSPNLKPAENNTSDKYLKELLARIIPVSDAHSKISMTVYGNSGSGKTRFACTFPKPLLILGAENGTQSVRTDEGVKFLEIKDPSEITIMGKAGIFSQYVTVVLDTATMLQDLFLAKVLKITQAPAQKSWGLATREQWQQVSFLTKEAMQSLLASDCNSVIIAQEREFEEKDIGINNPRVGSALSPSIVSWLHPSCNYVVQTFITPKTTTKDIKVGKLKVTKEVTSTEEVDFCLRIKPHQYYTIKYRCSRGSEPATDFIVNPTYEKFLSTI